MNVEFGSKNKMFKISVKNILLIVGFLVVLKFQNPVNSQGLVFFDWRYGEYDICGNKMLVMSKVFDVRPSKENFWDGTVVLRRQFRKLDEVNISFALDAPARLRLNPEVAEGTIIDQSFHIHFFNKSELTFRIEGESFGKFPNIDWFKINGTDACPKLIKWSPLLHGVKNEASIEFNGIRENSVVPQIADNEVFCGKRTINYQGFVTNGLSTLLGEWPWHAAMFHQNGPSTIRYKCGGTLIANNVVLTAAHCLLDNGAIITAERIIIKLGLHHRLISNPNTQEFLAYQVIPHEEFDSTFYRNDIALIKLATQAVYTDYVKPACLWNKNDLSFEKVVNHTGHVVGWGIMENETLSDFLRQGGMPIVPFVTCLESDRDFFGTFLSDLNYCAGFRNGTSVCNGDSGGGMFLKTNDKNVYQLRGLVSLSIAQKNKEICDSKEYVVFTDVAMYLDWIEKQLTLL